MCHLFAAPALALMIGFMAQRTGLCMVRGVEEFRVGRPTLLLGMLICGVWVWAFVPLASTFNVASPLHRFAFHWLFAVGGFVFGLGAAFNQGCAVSTLSRLARGEGRMLATIGGWMIGWYSWLQIGFDATHRQLPMRTGWPLGALILMSLSASVWALAGPPERRKLWLGVMLFGMLAGALFLFEPRWSPSDLVQDSSDAWFRGTGWPAAARFAIAAALITGMAWATWLTRGFRWHRIAFNQAALHLAAGTLMGVGAAMSLGGNDAQLLRALPTLSPAGMAAVFSIIVGIVAGSSLRRMLRSISVRHVLANKLN